MKYHILLCVSIFALSVSLLHTADARDALEDIKEKGVLTVCMDVRNLPYSNADPELPGLDVEIAQLLAAELGVKLELHWLDSLRDSLLADMLKGHCDCVIGIPIEERAMSESVQLGKRVEFSKPYYGTGYVLIKRKDLQRSPKTLEDIKLQTIGTEAGSIASDVLRQMGYTRRIYRSQTAVLDALQKGEIAYGCVWANAGWLIEKGSRIQRAARTETAYPELEVVDRYIPEPRLRWNVSIAFSKNTPERDTQALQDIVNTIIEQKWSAEKLKQLSQKYHLPYFAPFEEEEQK